jgi:Flp pilus assembly protein TadB
MSVGIWAAVSAVSMGSGWYALKTYDPTAERRRLTYARPSLRRLWPTIQARWIGPAQRQRLAVVGMSEASYGKDVGLYMGLGLLIGWFGLHQWLIGILGVGMGYGLVWLRVAGRYARWQKEVVGGIQELVRILKLRMMSGEKTSVAVERAVPFLTGALAVEWRTMLAQIHAGDSVEVALSTLDHRIGDRNFTAVLTRIRTYHRMGVPAEPFGDMAEHLGRVQMIQQEGRMKRLTAPLTMYALAGFLGLFLMVMLPTIIVQILQSLHGSPIL